MTVQVKWAGSEEAFQQLEGIYRKMSEASPEILKQASDWEDEQEGGGSEHHLLEMVNGVAVITIRGTLIEGSAGWWGMYYDICGYDDIRNAVAVAVNNGAKQIMVHIMSPGGMVVGIGALTEFLQKINKDVPLHFFADAFCASGGVWLATSTGKFLASQHAEVGSIGVIAVATEVTEMNKQYGINRKVFRSTPLKGVGNPHEKLSKEGEEGIQRGVDESAQRFIDHIAQGMKLSSDYVAENLAIGRMWYADEAKRLGLLSGITTFDELLVALQEKVSQNTNNAQVAPAQPIKFQSEAEADMARRKLIKTESSEEALAMAASGIPVILASDGSSENENDEDTDKDPDDKQVEGEEEGEGAAEDSAGNAGNTDSGKEEASTTINQLIAHTTEQLVAAKVELATVKAEASVIVERLTALQATEAQLKQIVARSVQRAFVASGAAAPSLEALTAMASDALIAQSESAESMLVKRFGTGGQTAVVIEEEEDEETKIAEDAAKQADEILRPLSRIFGTKQK